MKIEVKDVHTHELEEFLNELFESLGANPDVMEKAIQETLTYVGDERRVEVNQTGVRIYE